MTGEGSSSKVLVAKASGITGPQRFPPGGGAVEVVGGSCCLGSIVGSPLDGWVTDDHTISQIMVNSRDSLRRWFGAGYFRLAPRLDILGATLAPGSEAITEFESCLTAPNR